MFAVHITLTEEGIRQWATVVGIVTAFLRVCRGEEEGKERIAGPHTGCFLSLCPYTADALSLLLTKLCFLFVFLAFLLSCFFAVSYLPSFSFFLFSDGGHSRRPRDAARELENDV